MLLCHGLYHELYDSITLGSKFSDIQTIWWKIICSIRIVWPRLNWT